MHVVHHLFCNPCIPLSLSTNRRHVFHLLSCNHYNYISLQTEVTVFIYSPASWNSFLSTDRRLLFIISPGIILDFCSSFLLQSFYFIIPTGRKYALHLFSCIKFIYIFQQTEDTLFTTSPQIIQFLNLHRQDTLFIFSPAVVIFISLHRQKTKRKTHSQKKRCPSPHIFVHYWTDVSQAMFLCGGPCMHNGCCLQSTKYCLL